MTAAVAVLAALAGCAGNAGLADDDTTRARVAKALEASGDAGNSAIVLRGQEAAEASRAPDPIMHARQLIAFGQTEQGVAEARTALAARSDDPAFAIEVGRLVVRAGRLAEADIIYQDVLAHLPGSVEALNGHGVVLAQKGDLIGAAVAFRHALQLRPEDIPARNNLDLVMTLTNQSRKGLPASQ
jgi:Flp pilus assembly protein TadD